MLYILFFKNGSMSINIHCGCRARIFNRYKNNFGTADGELKVEEGTEFAP